MRTGLGYDSHRLVAGRRFVLGGVEIPHDKGLEGLERSFDDILSGRRGRLTMQRGRIQRDKEKE